MALRLLLQPRVCQMILFQDNLIPQLNKMIFCKLNFKKIMLTITIRLLCWLAPWDLLWFSHQPCIVFFLFSLLPLLICSVFRRHIATSMCVTLQVWGWPPALKCQPFACSSPLTASMLRRHVACPSKREMIPLSILCLFCLLINSSTHLLPIYFLYTADYYHYAYQPCPDPYPL